MKLPLTPNHQHARFVAAAFTCLLLSLSSFARAAALPGQADLLDVLDAEQYFVATDGDDAQSGLTPDQPKASIESVLTAIQQRKGYEWHNPFPGSSIRRRGPIFGVTGAESYGTDTMGPIIIWMRGGTYHLGETIRINFTDSHPLVIASYPGEEAILDGSRIIDGWEEKRIDGRRAWVARIPEVASGDWFFRQLFVDGERAPRAALPQTGYFLVKDSLGGLDNRFANQFQVSPADFGDFHNIGDIEISVMHYWINHRLAIENYDPATGMVKTVNRTTYPLIEAHPLHGEGNARYRLENVREGLDAPGEWYLDGRSGELTYLPRDGETLSNTRVSAPHLVQLLTIEGDLGRGRLVENIRLVGLAFQNTAIDFFSHNGTHNNAVNSGPGVVGFQAARNCSVEDCRFRNIGEYGVQLSTGSSLITVAGNRFEDMGCGAIKADGDWLATGSPAIRRTWMNWFTDNTILRGGRHYHGSPAMVVNKPGGTIVAHNRIDDFYYNGIALGGGPLNQFSGLETRIENNHISNIGQGLLSDMGAIYVHGTTGGVVVRGNVAHDVAAKVYGGSVLYLDAAASHVLVEDNLFFRANTHVINAKGRENIVRNNILAFGDAGIIRRAEFAPGTMNTVAATKNIMLTDGAPLYRSMPETHVLKTGGFVSEGNLIRDIGGKDLFVSRPQHHRQPDIRFSFEDWKRETGNDRLSVIADPLMRDPLNGDFEFNSTEAAERIGFRMPDFSEVGPRTRAERKANAAPAPTRRFEDHHE
jgi:hypothetical protein